MDENAAAGTVVALLSATDQDANSTFTYALVPGNGTNDTDNGLVTIVGNEVRVKPGALIDYKSNPVLNLNVRVTDNGGSELHRSLHDKCNNVNEAGTGNEGQFAAPYSASPGYTPSLGTNLDGLAYWSTAVPTLDLMKSAGAWLPQSERVLGHR